MAAATIDRVFFALSDPSRRTIIDRLDAGEATVGEASQDLGIAKASVSQHVGILESAGLIQRQVRGRQHWLSLRPGGFRDAATWLANHEEFWSQSVDRLAELAERLEREESS